jgi:hypothetical protein
VTKLQAAARHNWGQCHRAGVEERSRQKKGKVSEIFFYIADEALFWQKPASIEKEHQELCTLAFQGNRNTAALKKKRIIE